MFGKQKDEGDSLEKEEKQAKKFIEKIR